MTFASRWPVPVMMVPSYYQTIILAIDDSDRMRAKDVSPDRLTVWQGNAALRYVLPIGDDKLGVTAMAYSGKWKSTSRTCAA